jgi:hypothetical protein
LFSYIRRASLIVMSCLLIAPGIAHADSILNDLFPSVFGPRDTRPQPEDTLVAPFAKDAITGNVHRLTDAQKGAVSAPENTVAVNLPHRSDKYVGEWAADTVTTAMTFETTDFATKHKEKIGKIFVPFGQQEFLTWLDTSGLMAKMQAGQMRMTAFTRDEPTLLNEGEFDKVYRWLYQIPVTMSIMPSSMSTYSGRNKPTVFTQNLLVQIQIGRNMSPVFRDSIAIERWTVMPAP